MRDRSHIEKTLMLNEDKPADDYSGNWGREMGWEPRHQSCSSEAGVGRQTTKKRRTLEVRGSGWGITKQIAQHQSRR